MTYSNKTSVPLSRNSIQDMIDEIRRWANSKGEVLLGDNSLSAPIIPEWVAEKLERGEITMEQIRNVWAYGIPNPTDEQLRECFTRLGLI